MASAADPLGQSAVRYSRGAMWFHWIIAALIIVNLALGFFHEGFGKPAGAWMMFFHKSFGISVLVLSIGRLLWRLGHRPPPFDALMRPWEALAARITHWLFYVLMIGIPMTGWLLSSTGDHPISFFGLFIVPPLPATPGREAGHYWGSIHENLGIAMLVLIALHLGGAIKHYMDGHGRLVGRMAPWLDRHRGVGSNNGML
jgi:cytochrome b561